MKRRCIDGAFLFGDQVGIYCVGGMCFKGLWATQLVTQPCALTAPLDTIRAGVCQAFVQMEFNVMFDLNVRRAGKLSMGFLAVVSANALAQTSTTTLLSSGAWSSTIAVTINGKDSTLLLQKAQMDLAQSLPAGMRETAVATLNKSLTRVKATTCISSQTAAAYSSPQALFTSLSKMNPFCTFKAGRLTSTTQYFTGSCADPLSFTGNVSGKVFIDSATSWRSTFSGTGQVPDAVLQALALAPGTAVQLQSSSQVKWTSATCPTTSTTVAAAP